MKVLGIIPARYASQRFPGKSLADIAGKSLIHRVHERASAAQSLNRLVIATDDQRIYDHARTFGAEVLMTSQNCKNGTERCAEVHQLLPGYEAVINIQGDEPLLHSDQVDQLIDLIRNSSCQIATLANPLDESERHNPNIVKLALEGADGQSDQAIGFSRDYDFISNATGTVYKHVGLYAFQADCLSKIVALEPTPNEVLEKLEQLRWVDHGYEIKVGISPYTNPAVDVPEDINKILDLLKVNREN